MHDIVIRPLAQQDIKEIWRYTRKNWGEAQADRYILELGTLINSLAEHPWRGKAIDDVRTEYRQIISMRHLTIYRASISTIEIVRVLGANMDVTSHLSLSKGSSE